MEFQEIIELCTRRRVTPIDETSFQRVHSTIFTIDVMSCFKAITIHSFRCEAHSVGIVQN